MKKVLFLVVCFFSSYSYAVTGPIYKENNQSEIYREFINVYQGMKSISSEISTATTSIKGLELERSSFTVTAATATASTTFVNTTLTCSITLDSADNTVEFSAFGMVDNNGTNNTYWTVTRNGVNLGHTTDGFGRAAGQSSGFRYPWSIDLSDSPGATGLATYTVQIKVDAGSGGLCLSGYCKGTCVEIKK